MNRSLSREDHKRLPQQVFTMIGKNNMEIKIIANHINEIYILESKRTTRAIKIKIMKIRTIASIITITAAIIKDLYYRTLREDPNYVLKDSNPKARNLS